jgi:hypothetical protein
MKFATMDVGAARRVVVGESHSRLCKCGVVIANSSLVFSYSFSTVGSAFRRGLAFCTSSTSEDNLHVVLRIDPATLSINVRNAIRKQRLDRVKQRARRGRGRAACRFVSRRRAGRVRDPSPLSSANTRGRSQLRRVAGPGRRGPGPTGAPGGRAARYSLRGQWPYQGHDALRAQWNLCRHRWRARALRSTACRGSFGSNGSPRRGGRPVCRSRPPFGVFRGSVAGACRVSTPRRSPCTFLRTSFPRTSPSWIRRSGRPTRAAVQIRRRLATPRSGSPPRSSNGLRRRSRAARGWSRSPRLTGSWSIGFWARRVVTP